VSARRVAAHRRFKTQQSFNFIELRGDGFLRADSRDGARWVGSSKMFSGLQWGVSRIFSWGFPQPFNRVI
jgi:hypothetical protein